MIRYLYIDPNDFIGFYASYDTSPNIVIALGTFDDQKKQYNVIARECDAGSQANDMFYLVEGNAIMGYQNPSYSIIVAANRLKPGLNTLQF